jgi:hypothetical protein
MLRLRATAVFICGRTPKISVPPVVTKWDCRERVLEWPATPLS